MAKAEPKVTPLLSVPRLPSSVAAAPEASQDARKQTVRAGEGVEWKGRRIPAAARGGNRRVGR